MANRRMFSLDIVDSDAFLEMPASSQNLYFHLGMRADDDGFLNNPKKIAKTVGASEDDLKLLLAKRFLIAFDSGVVVIKHWKMNNLIRSDRYKPTAYRDELAMLTVKENGSYTDGIPNGNQVITNGIPSDNQWYADGIQTVSKRLPDGSQTVVVGQDSIGKVNKGRLDQSICDRLTDKQFTMLDQTYEDFTDLIDLIDERLSLSEDYIENPYAYIISVAKSERWATKP